MSCQLSVASYQKRSIKKYLDDLAAKKPAPGGGSAAALTGAAGAALLSMTANFTVDNPKYKQFRREIRRALRETEKIRQRLIELINLDVLSYLGVMKAKNKSQALYQKALKTATLVPLNIAKYSQEALKICPLLEAKANKYLISDVYVGKELLAAAVKSAVLNVKINLPFINNRRFISDIEQQLKTVEA